MDTCKRYTVLSCLVAILLSFAVTADAAQDISVIGTVLDQQTLSPLANASVSVVGGRVEARTESDGNFALPSLPPGTAAIRVSAPGYSATVDEIEITAGEIVFIQLPLVPLAAMLDEVLVMTRQHSAEQVSTVPLESSESALTAADLLARQVPGLSFRRANGAVGAGARITIRGVSSITQNTDPVIFLDGVRIGMDSSSSLAGRSAPSISVLDQISAAEVRSIRVLRGSSAAARYGDSSNGVILIETRREPGN